MDWTNAKARARSHSDSAGARASRKVRRGPASRRCQAAMRSRAGSAGPRPPTSRTPTRRPSRRSTLPGMRSLWLITSGAVPRGRSRIPDHRRRMSATSSSSSLSMRHRCTHSSWVASTPPRPLPEKRRPSVGIDRTSRTNSARSAANPWDAPGSPSAVSPGSHVCTDHGSGYPAPGAPIASGFGVGKPVRPSSSRAASASASSARRASAGSAGWSGNRAARSSPTRKIACTVPDEATGDTGRPRHRGNWASISS